MEEDKDLKTICTFADSDWVVYWQEVKEDQLGLVDGGLTHSMMESTRHVNS